MAGNQGHPLCKLRSTACRVRWPAGSSSGETTSGVRQTNSPNPKTSHCGGWPNGWWEFLLRLPPPGHPGGNRSLRLWESRSPCRQSGDSVSCGERSLGLPVIEIVDVALRSYLLTPANEPKLTNPEEVPVAIRDFKFSKAPGPNGIPNRALKHSHSECFPSWSWISRRSSSPITFLQCGSDLYTKTGERSSTALIL